MIAAYLFVASVGLWTLILLMHAVMADERRRLERKAERLLRELDERERLWRG